MCSWRTYYFLHTVVIMKRKSYEKWQLDEAVDACRQRKLSIMAAAKLFNVPPKMVSDHIGNRAEGSNLGPNREPTNVEEDVLVE